MISFPNDFNEFWNNLKEKARELKDNPQNHLETISDKIINTIQEISNDKIKLTSEESKTDYLREIRKDMLEKYHKKLKDNKNITSREMKLDGKSFKAVNIILALISKLDYINIDSKRKPIKLSIKID